MRTILVEPENGKGRSFQGYLAAHLCADALWSGGEAATDNLRPVWAVIFGSEGEIRPLIANLRMGKKAIFGDNNRYNYRRKTDKLEFLKSGRYSSSQQRFPEGVAVTLYLHDLFTLDPGMVDPAGISFVLAPPRANLEAQVWDTAQAQEHLLALQKALSPELLALAPYFAAYLDRRSRSPWPTDTRFYAQLLYDCLALGLASLPDGNREWGHHSHLGFSGNGCAEVGLAPCVAFKAKHEEFEAVLANATKEYFNVVGF